MGCGLCKNNLSAQPVTPLETVSSFSSPSTAVRKKSFMPSNEKQLFSQVEKRAEVVKQRNLFTGGQASGKSFDEIDTLTPKSGKEFNGTTSLQLQMGESEVGGRHNHVVVGESEEVLKHNPEWSKPHQSFAKSQNDTAIISSCLKTHFLFQSFSPESLYTIVDEFEPETVELGTVLSSETDNVHHAAKFFVVGDAQVTGSRGGKNICTFPDKGGERGFGDLALMVDTGNKMTYTVSKAGVLFSLSRIHLHRLVVEESQARTDKFRGILKQVNMLKSLTETQLMEFADHLVQVRFAPGETIVKERDTGKNFYIVEKGVVTMHKGRDRNPILEIREGHFFGERALLSNAPRQNTFRAKGDVICLVLGSGQFHDMFGDHLKNHMDDVHKARQEEIKMVPYDCESFDPRSVSFRRYIGKGSFGLVSMVSWKDKPDSDPLAVKQIEKKCLVKTGQMYNVVREKKIMQLLQHPHIAKLEGTYSDADSLFFVLEYLAGGHVYHWLWKARLKFTLKRARLYTACVADSLIYMHSKNILYRDLKLENLCLNHRGVIKLIDFGLSKHTEKKTFTTAGTPEYMAPEMITGRGHHKAVDYWALGISMYEMICGFTTFGMWVNKNPPSDLVVFQRSSMKKPKFPSGFDEDAKMLVLRLLEKNPAKRLGCLKCGGDGIRKSEFYSSVDWKKVQSGTSEIPFKPPCTDINDTNCHENKLNDKYKYYKAEAYVPDMVKGTINGETHYDNLWDQHFVPHKS